VFGPHDFVQILDDRAFKVEEVHHHDHHRTPLGGFEMLCKEVSEVLRHHLRAKSVRLTKESAEKRGEQSRIIVLRSTFRYSKHQVV
jgi:hypothetical protein